MKITQIYNELRGKSSEYAFNTILVPNFHGVYLGVSSSGRPCLFIDSGEDKLQEPSMKTSHITLGLGVDYTVSVSGCTPRVMQLDSLLCESDEELDERTFISLVDGFLNTIGKGEIKRANLITFFLSVSKLFSITQAKDLESERQGLWGELFFMAKVKGFGFWFPFWHSEPTRKFDFSGGTKRLEVKTSIGNERVHQFAHRQVYSFGGEEIALTSILLRKEDSGLSLRKLIDSARDVISTEEELIKLARSERIAGMDNGELGPCFDDIEAENSLALFWAKEIPHFTMAEPSGVSQTHYRIDLTNAPCISQTEFEEWLSMWPKTVEHLERTIY